MEYLEWASESLALRSPTLIVAFKGWNDAGDASSMAAEYLIEHLDGELLATIDCEPFYDFTETRPSVAVGENQREVVWPVNEVYFIEMAEAERDLIVLVGHEPQLKWRTYIDQVLSVIEECEVELVVSLGALIADVVHSRPATVYTTTDDPEILDKLTLEPSNYEGPTGIVGVLNDVVRSGDPMSLSLWGTVPSYVSHVPSPKATLSLVQRVAQLTGAEVPTSLLEAAVVTYESQVNRLVEEDQEIADYVAELEESYDAGFKPESGAELIAELEAFLREREGLE